METDTQLLRGTKEICAFMRMTRFVMLGMVLRGMPVKVVRVGKSKNHNTYFARKDELQRWSSGAKGTTDGVISAR